MINNGFRAIIVALPVTVLGLALGGLGLGRARQDRVHTLGLAVWRKSIIIGEDTPMRADMLMTQRRHGKTITTKARIIQGPHGKYRMQYQLPKEANGRIVFSDGRANWQFEPGKNMLAKTTLAPMWEQRDRDLERLIEGNYEITLVSDKAAAAGRQAFLVNLAPRQSGKSSQKRWIDRKTGKTLRIETHYTDGILARMVSYTNVELPASVSDADFLPGKVSSVQTVSAKDDSFYLATHTIPSMYSSLLLKPTAALGFELIEISSGEIDDAQATQFLYSDGIESVSVFVQKGPAAISSIPPNWTKVAIGNETAYQNLDGHLDALTWIKGGYRFTAVSHLVPDALAKFAESQLK
jgi:outer membrane lipoprotein-sorting protein